MRIRLLSSTPIRCSSCGVWAQTTRRAIKTPRSFGGWALQWGSPESAVSLVSRRSTALVNEASPGLGGDGEQRRLGSEQLIPGKCAPSVSLCWRISAFCCLLSFLQRQRRDFLFQQRGSGSTDRKLRRSLIKHKIWQSINSPSADWRRVGNNIDKGGGGNRPLVLLLQLRRWVLICLWTRILDAHIKIFKKSFIFSVISTDFDIKHGRNASTFWYQVEENWLLNVFWTLSFTCSPHRWTSKRIHVDSQTCAKTKG